MIVKLMFIGFFYLWNLLEGFKLDTHYPHKLVVLYVYPLWRAALLLLLIAGGLWCEPLALMIAASIFFYFMDMQLLLYKEI
jgi:hypothetical protein